MKVFVIAMASEAEAVISQLEAPKRETVHGREVIEGRLAGEDAAVVISGVGKVNAAAATQLAIDRYAPESILNIGVAGAIDGAMKVGEIYAVSKAFQCDFDLSQINPAPRGTPNEYDSPWFELEVPPGFRAAICATGDSFDNGDGDREFVRGRMGASLRDMELGAIAHVCRHAGVRLVSLKGVSDVHAPGLPPPTTQYAENLKMCVEALKQVVAGK